MSAENNDDRVRPMDEVAKQMYRDDPGHALWIEGQGRLYGFYFLLAICVFAFIRQALR